MDGALFETNLKVLTEEDPWPHNEWKEALAFFRKTAEEGSDISRAAQAIEGLFLKCHHIDIMALAADTLVAHYLNIRDYDALSGPGKEERKL